MPQVTINVPKSVMRLPEADRDAILGVLAKAARLPAVMPVYHEGSGNEHDMWDSNPESLLGQAEDDLYITLNTHSMERLAEVFTALGLPLPETADLEKSMDFDLLKSQHAGKNRMRDLVQASKAKRNQFIAYMQDMNPFTRQQLKKLDNLLKKRLPNYAKIAEDFATRAGFIGKIRNSAEQQAFETMGALVDRFPTTIREGRTYPIVLTTREQERASEGKSKAAAKKITVLPLTPQEARTVEQASLRAADKMVEVDARHAAGIRQLVLQAQRERWTPQQLADALFEAYGEQNRDWRRVAITELAMAANDAYLSGCAEGDQVIGMGADDACKHCKKYVIGKQFTVTHKLPQNNHHHEMNFVWPGKSNYGRKVATFIPAIPFHPNCRCRWHRISRFYKMEEGKAVLKSAAELIQEERARRGLPPDPNL